MSQSSERVKGREWPPRSFGRQPAPEPEETAEGDFRIVGGQAFHLVLHVDVTPSAESVQHLYDTIRAATAAAVRDGYVDAVSSMAEDEEQAVADLEAKRAGAAADGGGEGSPAG
ncbi:hypothetical protein AB0F93_00230 [Micromonospora tulbaghiae]|uniref:hypothetical protein n=1 Tax=Micromonospora tulbaghiae TaxID=479978 RepID=UPI00332A5016